MTPFYKVLVDLSKKYDVSKQMIQYRTGLTISEISLLFSNPNPNIAELLVVVSAISPKSMFCIRTSNLYVSEYTIYTSVGNLLRRVRRAEGKTQEDIASALEVTRTNIVRTEKARSLSLDYTCDYLAACSPKVELFIYDAGKMHSLI